MMQPRTFFFILFRLSIVSAIMRGVAHVKPSVESRLPQQQQKKRQYISQSLLILLH